MFSKREEVEGGSQGEEIVVEEEGGIPTISQLYKNPPPEYYPIVGISIIVCIFVIGLFVKRANDHRCQFTRNTIQCVCTVGVILTFPVFVICYISGIIVPKAMAKVVFLSEAYEAISLIMFLRLIITYLGGKKRTKLHLKGNYVALNSPPLCCFICLPHIKFTRKFFVLNEILILQLVAVQLVLGYIDLLIGLDASHDYPAALIEETYHHVFHIVVLFSLLLAIYGLGGIYHTAEAHLSRYSIFWKFILWKVFVTVVKFQEFLTTFILKKVFTTVDLSYGPVSTELRVHIWCYFLVLLEAACVFPHVIRYYSLSDYPSSMELIEEEMSDVERGSSTYSGDQDEERIMVETAVVEVE